MRIVAATLGVVMLVTPIGCAKVWQDPIVGKWQEIGGDGWAEYLPDGTAVFSDGLHGTWQRLEDRRFKLEVAVLGTSTTEVYRLEFRDDGVTLIDSKGQVGRYRRAKPE